MQKILIALGAFALFSCNADEKKAPDAKEETKVASASSSLPYTATYSSQFEIGDAKNVEMIMNVWKAWDDGNLQASRKYFADTMHFYFRDGNKMAGPTDSTLAGGQMVRNLFTAVKSTIQAIVPLKSTDKNENWVCVWGTEVSTDKQGKTDSVDLQETWRLNKDGKVDLLYQYGRALVPMAASK
jgi:hypothetical protein